MGKKAAPAAATALGLHEGQVLAVGMTTGECPVGLVVSLNDDYFTLDLFDWLIGEFAGSLMDIPYSLVERTMLTTYAEDQGRKVYQMDRLGTFQTNWHREPSERAL